MTPKTQKNIRRDVLACAVLASVLTVFLIVRHASAQVPQPGLTIELTAPDEYRIKITNGVGYANYEIYRQRELNPNKEWILHTIGAQGQTNFTTNMGIFFMGFFRAAVGSDWDGDGVPNSQDGQPTNSTVGSLMIVIDSPATGTDIQ